MLITRALVAVFSGAVPACAQVAVTGGRDKEAVNFYRWTVTNQGDKPITRFEFPRYVVDDIEGPKGWIHEIVKTTADGKPIKPHRIVYKAGTASAAIRPGASAVFVAQINIDKATPGRQTVLVGFDDGSTLEVGDVEIPWDYPWLEKHALLIGMGALFGVFLLVQVLRGRRGERRGLEAHEARQEPNRGVEEQ